MPLPLPICGPPKPSLPIPGPQIYFRIMFLDSSLCYYGLVTMNPYFGRGFGQNIPLMCKPCQRRRADPLSLRYLETIISPERPPIVTRDAHLPSQRGNHVKLKDNNNKNHWEKSFYTPSCDRYPLAMVHSHSYRYLFELGEC